MLKINSSNVLYWCLIAFGIVCAGHILGVITTFGLSNFEKGTHLIHDLFYFTHEKSISSLYSAALFVILSYYFKTISTTLTNNTSHWRWLSYIAIFIACDEWFAIHDASLNIYGMGALNIPIWLGYTVPWELSF
jgi:hypothetical protein